MGFPLSSYVGHPDTLERGSNLSTGSPTDGHGDLLTRVDGPVLKDGNQVIDQTSVRKASSWDVVVSVRVGGLDTRRWGPDYRSGRHWDDGKSSLSACWKDRTT